MQGGPGGVTAPGGVVQSGEKHRHVQSAGGVPHRDDPVVAGTEQGDGDGEVLVVDALRGDVVPGLAVAVAASALAQVDGVDGEAAGVEVLGDVGLEEEVGHAVHEEQGRTLRPLNVVGCIVGCIGGCARLGVPGRVLPPRGVIGRTGTVAHQGGDHRAGFTVGI